MTHIINGMAGNIESHSTLDAGESTLPLTAFLDFQHYGFNKMKFINSTALTFNFIQGDDGSSLDQLTLIKRKTNTTCLAASSSPTPSGTASSTGSGSGATSSPSYTTSGATRVGASLVAGALAMALYFL